VRLAFLDVLQEQGPASAVVPPAWPGATIELGAGGYARLEERGANGWLRRNSGLLGLLGVLLACLLIGLLVGHWAGQGNKAPAKQVVEIKGLTGLPAAAATSAPSTAATSETPAASTASAKQEAAESKEAAKETKAEKAPPPAPVKVTPAKLQKLSKTTGKQHQEEVNALGAQPIETG
jgi:predicted lipid-binding transport protein (Tim44 family)